MLEKYRFDQPKTSKVPKSNLPDSSIVDISGAFFILRIHYTQIQCVKGARDVKNIRATMATFSGHFGPVIYEKQKWYFRISVPSVFSRNKLSGRTQTHSPNDI